MLCRRAVWRCSEILNTSVAKNTREREREFYFTPAKPGCGHMATAPEGGMSLRLRGESKVQARRAFYLSVVQLFTQGHCVQSVEH